MPRKRIQRFYYRNDRIHVEIREMDGKLHGLYRTWHFNGKLAEELTYRHGLLHGISRQWNEDGHLLGSFTINHGTGTQRYWHGNGRLQLEMDCVNGMFNGRTRTWLQDGTLTRETYLIADREVTRIAYLKAARKNPDWPQYAGEPRGRVARAGIAIDRKQYELFIESILEKSHAEARQWLNAGIQRNRRSLPKFRTASAALRFVEALYEAGADTVTVAPVYTGTRGKLFADWLLIELPLARSKRRGLRALCHALCRKCGGAMLPEADFGESHLFLRLA